MQDGGVIPVTGFPRVSDKRGGPSNQRFDHGANMGISYNTSHAYGPRASFRRLYLSKVHLRSGSSSVKEVGVLTTVVVHGRRGSSCSRVVVGSCPSRGDGSCSPDGLWKRSRHTGFVDVRVEGSGT